MSWRTIIISNQAKLDYKMGFMLVRGGLETKKVVIDEIAVLLIENPAVSFTGCLIEELIHRKVKVIFCDSKRSPIAELVPHHGSHDSTAKIRSQFAWSKEVKSLIWEDIIAEKIRKQAELLQERGKDEQADLLLSYIGQIESYDETNREGHAAKVYFNALFGMDFTRSDDNPINAALNYGYSLLLSTITREVSANGYLSQLGIFHDNMFNHFNLSCDLMEPFRVVIDRYVINNLPDKFETEEKHNLWYVLQQEVMIDGTHQNLLNAMRIYAHSVFDAINDGDPSLIKNYKIVK